MQESQTKIFENLNVVSVYDREKKIDKMFPMWISHVDKEIRLELSKKYLTDFYLSEIIYSILKTTCFYPDYKTSLTAREGDISSYTLIVNGYLIDGRVPEKGKKHKSIIVNFIDDLSPDIDDLECVREFRDMIKISYNDFKSYFGKEKIVINFGGKFKRKNCINYSKFMKVYLREKGIEDDIFYELGLFRCVAYL